MSNLKQIGLGVMQYTQDYDERYPIQTRREVTDYANSTYENWIGEIQPYVKSWQLFVCPSATDVTGSGAPIGNSDTNYLGNGVVFQRGLSLAAVDTPANIILVSEYGTNTYNAYMRPGRDTAVTSLTSFRYWLNNDTYSGIHLDGGNLLFADGHAKWKKHTSICAAEFGLEPNASSTPACGTAGSAYATAIF